MVKGWTEVAKFGLSRVELEKVFVFDDKVATVNNYEYADTLATALSGKIPGRYISFSKPTVNKKSIVFRFAKQCSSSKTFSCAKKWKIFCLTEPLMTGLNEFIVSTNDVDCNHQQPLVPRHLSGESVLRNDLNWCCY